MTDERPRDLMVFEDLEEPRAWRVELVRRRWRRLHRKVCRPVGRGDALARDYHDAIANGRLGTRIAEAHRDAGQVLRFPRK